MPPAPDAQPPRRRGRRPTIGLDEIVAGTIALLDDKGEDGLTLRALAATLETGTATLYWHVDGRDDLVSRAVATLLGKVLDDTLAADTARGETDPLDRVRALSLDLFAMLDRHPWMGPHLMSPDAERLESLRVFDYLGRQLTTLGLSPDEQFYGVSAVVNYVIGVGSQMARGRFTLPEPRSRDEFLATTTTMWASQDPEVFPFVTAQAETLRRHDDEDQFATGLELILVGLRTQAEARTARERAPRTT